MKRSSILLGLLFFSVFNFSQQLPLDFSNGNQSFFPFNGAHFSFINDPLNNTTQVGRFYNDGSHKNQGFFIDLKKAVDLSRENTFTLSFYSFDTDRHTITLKLENGGDNPNVETTIRLEPKIGWQNDVEVNFNTDFGTYTRLTIFLDLGEFIEGTYLLDNITDGSDTDTSDEDPVYNTLVWSDEFDSREIQSAVDPSKWHHQTFPPLGDGNWFNGEEQHYTDRVENSYVKDGFLHIVAKREDFTSFETRKAFTSARLNSKFAFTYGRVDVKAKLPQGDGTWPAIWTLGKNITETGAFWAEKFGTVGWPACGEIDIMEHGLGGINHTSSAIHTPSSFGGTVNTSSQTLVDVANNFYKYSLIWSPNKIVFLVDDVPYYTYDPPNKNLNTWPFNSDQFLLLNVAMGGVAGPIDSRFTEGEMVVDYVRVYQSEAMLSTQTFKKWNLGLELYPNPAKNQLFIKSNKIIEQVGLYNTIGKRVFQQKHNNKIVQLFLNGLAKGIYFVKILSEGKLSTQKIIVQ